MTSPPSFTSTTANGIAGIIGTVVAGVLNHFFPGWSWLTDLLSGALATSVSLIALRQHAAPPPVASGSLRSN